MAARWIRPEPGHVFELTVLWAGMLAPITFQAEAWRWEDHGGIDVVTGLCTPRIEALTQATPMLMQVREIPIPQPEPFLPTVDRGIV